MYCVSATPLGKSIGRRLDGLMIVVNTELPKTVIPILRWEVIENNKLPVFALYSNYDMALAKLAYLQSLISEGEYLKLIHTNKLGTLKVSDIGVSLLGH